MRRRTLLVLPAAVLTAAAACARDDTRDDARDERKPVSTERHEYGEDPAQYAELTRPDGEPQGVAVLVHGGFWKPQYGIEYAQPLVPSLIAHGWATWAIEYRRGTGAADTLADVRAAIDALPVEAGTVVGIGHSAGGHLATWAAAGGGFTHVVSQAGVLDLRAAYEENLGDGAVERFLGHPPGPADAGVDPIRMLPLDVHVWCVHGRADDVVPIGQSRAYVEAAGAGATLVEVAGDHFTVVDPDSGAWARTLEILDRL
ncbi:alpha/beta hydrolase family protein [Nocardioides aquiterrae]|uniref:alpha/beta hydrolase family protein n=1 Tax=Nocardioides aquiterrae TaxID=203799 RepID=UPI0031D43ED9